MGPVAIDMPFLRARISCTTEFISYKNNEVDVVVCCGKLVCDFYVYQDIWMQTTGEYLSCQTEDSNVFDP